jgi:hypothetical protein
VDGIPASFRRIRRGNAVFELLLDDRHHKFPATPSVLTVAEANATQGKDLIIMFIRTGRIREIIDDSDARVSFVINILDCEDLGS